VTVYRLIARGTIEEKILALHADKRSMVAGILEGTSSAARLSTKDLLALISGTPK
jgi:SNF2 family DNA or RNA helicase